jgi:hypothetical protein
MATYTVGPTGDFTTLALAVTGSVNGDTITCNSDYVHPNIATVINKDLTITSTDSDASSVILMASATNTLNIQATVTVTHLTIICNKSTRRAFYAPNEHLVIEDCVVKAVFQCVIFWSALELRRTKFLALPGGHTYSIYGLPGATLVADSCLFEGWKGYGLSLYGSVANVRNCTVIMDQTTSSSTSAGIYAPQAGTTVRNCTVFGRSGTDWGIWAKSAGTTVENCVSWNSSTDYIFQTGATGANNYNTADVVADGNPVFVDFAAGDFHPDTSGLAYHNGDAASAPATDIDNLPFDSPPSIGCYEAPSSGGGGPYKRNKSPSLGLSNPFSLDL